MTTSDDKFYRAKITSRVEFAPDLWAVRLNPGGEFKFAPGQYATLGLESVERRWERPYSIVSSPDEEELEFFFELVPEGKLTPSLYKLQSGDELLMRKVPKGRFTLETKGARTNHLLVSTVTGVAPFVSYVRSLYKDWKEGKFSGEHKLFLLNGASRSWEFGYSKELQRFADELPWLKYVPTVSRPWDDPRARPGDHHQGRRRQRRVHRAERGQPGDAGDASRRSASRTGTCSARRTSRTSAARSTRTARRP